MDSTQLTLEVLKLIVTTLATGVAAAFGIKIASSQRNISRQQKDIALEAKDVAAAKLNFDLFEERYAVFFEVWGFLSDGENRQADSPLLTDFTNLIPKAQFLFGREIADYMREADTKRTQLIIANLNYQRTMSMDESKIINDNANWFFNESTNCYKRFAHYLDFSEWQAQRWTKGMLQTR